MIISLTSSFSVLIDNYLLSADSGIPTEQERIVYLSVKLLFYLMIYCSVKNLSRRNSMSCPIGSGVFWDC
mgnify:CR=1 FL=1